MLHIKGGKIIDLNNEDLSLPGFKHALVSTLCSTVLFPDTVFHFTNVPKISDTTVLIEILDYLGASCTLKDNDLMVNTQHIESRPIPVELSKQVHGALYLFPVLLARFGESIIGQTGGCAIGDINNIGSRPFEHMLRILNMFGFEFENHGNQLLGKRKSSFNSNIIINIKDFSIVTSELTGPYISGATKTALLLGGTLGHNGTLTILNPYTKPDVTELLRLYQLLQFETHISPEMISVKRCLPLPELVEFNLLGDLSVLMTYITLAVLFKKNLSLKNDRMSEFNICLSSEFELLTKMGVKIQIQENILEVIPPDNINSIDIEVLSTSIYSDHQPFFALMLLYANDKSTIREYVWENRFSYARELTKLGHKLDVNDNKLTIYPSVATHDTSELHARDLRAAAVLLIASCHAKGDHYLTGYEHLQRGYENLIEQLTNMGAEISRL